MSTPRLHIEGGKVMIHAVGAPGHEDDPWNDPLGHVASIYYYSEWDTYQVAPGYPVSVPMSYPSVSPATGYQYGPFIVYTTRTLYDWPLSTHGLGYIPRYILADGAGNLLPPAFPIQRVSGGHRSVCAYATTSQIILHEIRDPGNATLGAFSDTYQLVVFRQPAAVAGAPLADIRPSRTRLGHDKIDTDIASMRLAKAGESGVLFPLGVTVDVANGQGRWVTQDGTVVETNSQLGGISSAYNGSFTGSPSLRLVVT